MENFSAFIKDLESLIACKSVLDKPKKGKPFGEGVYSALEQFLSIAKRLGFETKNYEGYIGEITLGKGEEIGIIGHLDVVPEGEGWLTDPYVLTEKDGVYYGRGLLDDKSPMLLTLYILKELKESKKPVNKKFRLFLGCNEESGWQDAEYFKKNYGFPEYGFSPDGNFPVSYAEKGMAIAEFKLPLLKNYDSPKGGMVINAVCGYASVKDKSGRTVEFNGKSCHGSRPEGGINAIKLMYEYLEKNGEDVKEIVDCFFNDKYGVMKMENEQGDITFSPDIICEKDGAIYLQCDCRFPYPFTLQDVKDKFDKFGYPYTISLKHGTQYVEKEGAFVDTLIKAYNGVMKENLSPISQSGSTFARVFEKGVAFGPEFPLEPSTIHEPNECVKKEQLETMYKIYKKAIFDLAK